MTVSPALPLNDLLASLTAVGHSLRGVFDPRGFLDAFSARLQPVLPHDRLVVDVLEEDGRTFTVLAEHVVHGARLHETHYTTALDRERYLVAEWVLRTVFRGETMLVEDVRTDPRFADANEFERRLGEAGVRAALLVPLVSGGTVIGALVLTALTAAAYDASHLEAARRVGETLGALVDSVVLLERERRRRHRLRAVQGLTPVLGATLDVRDVFTRLAEGVRPVLDFDVMGVCLVSASGRDLEMLAEVNEFPADTPPRIPLADFSFAERVEQGEVHVIRDARTELSPAHPGDRLIVANGGRACLTVPLRFGDTAGGALYFGKRKPDWFDAADIEVAEAIAAQLTLVVQHQRLAEEQRRLAAAETRARRLEQRVESLRSELAEPYGFDRIVGRSAPLREALTRAAKVAPTEATALVTGESGTGKELVARAIHYASTRADGPFVALNCAALPDTLLESELFGHEKGAFTGADRQKPGRFELAAGGTLFLDEVSELSPVVQAKLLRVLQEREFQRVGGTATLRADVRLLAATNRDLGLLVEQGRFRDDLFYRLNVFTVHLPPLRERGDDVLLLATHFTRTLAARMGKVEAGLARDARDALLAHRWPGNIRELANAIERALIVSEGGLLTCAELALAARGAPPPARADATPVPAGPPDAGTPASPASAESPASLAEWERRIVADALARAGGNKSEAARLLGLTRSQLYTRLKRG